jgi:hypothetical protein
MKPLLLLVFLPLLPAQVLEGDVVNAVTGAPVAGARVSIFTVGAPERIFAASDAAGHFRIAIPGPMSGSLIADRPGFLSYQSERYYPGHEPAPNARIELTPQAVISGKVEDADGFGVEASLVQVLRYQVVAGELKLQRVAPAARTNDLGEFRIGHLSAGRYYVCSSAGNVLIWDSRYTGECSSGTMDPRSGNAIQVNAGEEMKIPLRLTRRAGVTVSGRIAMPAGLPPPRFRAVTLQPSEEYRALMALGGTVQRDGSFAIQHALPRSYFIRSSTGQTYPPKPGDLYAEQRIQVGDSDLRDIKLAASEVRAVSLSGKVVAEDGRAPGPVTIGLRPTGGAVVAAIAGADGAFEFQGLWPQHYGIMVNYPPSRERTPLRAFSARLDGREVLESGFDLGGAAAGPLLIRLSARLASFEGQVLDAGGHAVPNAVVLLAGAEGRILMCTDLAGKFTSSLAFTGDYRVYVLSDDSQFDLLEDPEYLKAHQGDFPPVHLVAERNNPPLTIRLK